MNSYAIKKVLPHVLLGASTIGVAGTGILASKAGEKSCQQKLSGEPVWKNYIWTAVVGTATVACMWGSHLLTKKQTAALMAACGYLAASKRMIEEKIQERFGEEELISIKREVMAELEHEPWGKISIPSAEETGHGEVLVIEGYSGRTFRSSIEAVDAGIKKFQKMLVDGHYCALNDLYECFGICATHFGNQFGWPNDGDWWDLWHSQGGIRIETCYIENPVDIDEPVYVIDIYDYPMECWLEL